MRLLVIEDDSILRTQIQERAQASGFVVDTADNVVEAHILRLRRKIG